LDQTWEIIPEKNTRTPRWLRATYLYMLGLPSDFDKTSHETAPPATRSLDPIDTRIGQCHGCFRVRGDQDSCAPPPNLLNEAWVCLGKYQSVREKLTPRREMMITKLAYDTGILLDLVLFSLQTQADGELESKSQGKAAEKRGERAVP
jgi:hypothetical protein